MSVTPLYQPEQGNDRPRSIVVGRFSAAPVLLLTAWSLVGCYTYVPVATQSPRIVSGGVRLVLTPAGSEGLRQLLGANVREVEGVIARSSPDTLVLAVQHTVSRSGERFESSGDTVAVQRRFVESVAVQQYSRKRSVSLAVAIALFLVIGLTGIVTGSSGFSGTGQPGSPQP